MIFTFWVDPGSVGVSKIDSAASEWRSFCPEFQVYSDDLIVNLIRAHDLDRHNLYCRIRIPSCRSDIARLVLLYALGGMYVDVHTGVGNKTQLLRTIRMLATHELVLFDKRFDHVPPQPFSIINGAICARRLSPILKTLIVSAFENLKSQYDLEAINRSYHSYNIAVLTGGWHLYASVFDISNNPVHIKPDLRNKISIAKTSKDIDCGVIFHKYRGYQSWQNHWSERQKREFLFYHDL